MVVVKFKGRRREILKIFYKFILERKRRYRSSVEWVTWEGIKGESIVVEMQQLTSIGMN